MQFTVDFVQMYKKLVRLSLRIQKFIYNSISVIAILFVYLTLLYLYLSFIKSKLGQIDNNFDTDLSENAKFPPTKIKNFAIPTELQTIAQECKLLWSQNLTQRTEAANIARKVTSHVATIPIVSTKSKSKSCNIYFNTRREYYRFEPVNEAEQNFSLAFILVVYKEFSQLEQLFMMIYRPQNFYCFHVDTKAHGHFENQVRRLTSCFSHNVFMVTTPTRVKWGTYSVLEAELFCQRDLLVRSNKWKYVINLTGEEFPLVTNFGLVSLLRAINGANLILGPEDLSKKQLLNESRYPPELPFNLKPFKSGVHYALTRKAVEFIMKNNTALTLLRSLYDLRFAEEAFFSTLQFNSRSNIPGGLTLDADTNKFEMNHITRFKIWSFKKKKKCLSKRKQRSICIIGVNYLHTLVNEAVGKHLYVNKFLWRFQPRAWDCMHVWYQTKVSEEYKTGRTDLNLTYFVEHPHVKWARKIT